MHSNTILKWLLAFVAVVGIFLSSPATAQSIDLSSDPLASEQSFREAVASGNFNMPAVLGRYEAAPGLFFNYQEMRDLSGPGCTGGPNGLLRSLIIRSTARGEMCGEDYIDDLDGVLTSGASAWFATVTPLGVKFELYTKGVGNTPNILCFGTVPYTNSGSVNISCIDSKSGGMLLSETVHLIARTAAFGLPAIMSNLTTKASRYTTNISNGSGSTSTSGSGSTSTSGSNAEAGAAANAASIAEGAAAPDVYVTNNNTANGGEGGAGGMGGNVGDVVAQGGAGGNVGDITATGGNVGDISNANVNQNATQIDLGGFGCGTSDCGAPGYDYNQ